MKTLVHKLNHLDIYKRWVTVKKGEHVDHVDPYPLNETYSLSLMTTLSGETPFVFSLKSGTNDQYDFLDFLVFLVKQDRNTVHRSVARLKDEPRGARTLC
jgi:hypothetical protein